MTTPLRVAFVSSHAGDGGSERFLDQLLDQLGDRVHPTVIVLQDGPLVDRLRARDPVIVPTGTRLGLLTGAARLRRLLRDAQYDVVHANGIKAALVTVLATRGGLAKLPVVWVKHDHSRDGRLARFVAGRVSMVVGVSRSVLAALPPTTPTRVVSPGVPPTPSTPNAGYLLRETIGIGSSTRVLLSVGRLDRAKGHALAVTALARVRLTHPDATLVIVGGPEPTQPGVADELRSAARDAGVADVVHLLGQRDDVPALLAGADVTVVASHPVDQRGMGAEGFGLVAVESMAVGTPVVGFSAGALPEVLGNCGVLVAVGDVDALAAAVCDLLSDDDRRARLAECGRERAAAFDPAATASALLDTYRAVSVDRS
jgi:glycosyltransferase involved in cell wall biosynthesis